jgi:hypothetical protein
MPTVKELKGLYPDCTEEFLSLNATDGQGQGFEDAKGSKTPSKYKNIRTELNGRTYASGKEAKRAQDLQLMEKAGEIFNLGYQVKFPLFGGVSYVADFVYLDDILQPVIEDSKGTRTREYINKAKQFKAKYGIAIRES